MTYGKRALSVNETNNILRRVFLTNTPTFIKLITQNSKNEISLTNKHCINISTCVGSFATYIKYNKI